MGWSFRDFFDVDDGLSGHGVVLLRVWIAVLALEESFFSHRRFVPSKFLSSNNFFHFFFIVLSAFDSGAVKRCRIAKCLPCADELALTVKER